MKSSASKIYVLCSLVTYLVTSSTYAAACDAFCLLNKISYHIGQSNRSNASSTKPFDLNKAQIKNVLSRQGSPASRDDSDGIASIVRGPNSDFTTCPEIEVPRPSSNNTFSNFGTERNGSDVFTYDEKLSDTANIENQTSAPTPSSSISAELPNGDPETDGFYRYNDGDRNVFGTNSVIWQLTEAGKKLAESGMSMGIGDISKKGGGKLPPHQTHRDGKSVDMRFVGHDGQAKACVYTNRCYSRENTKVMLETLINVNPSNVRLVYLNDPILREEMKIKFPDIEFKNCAGHDNHLHVNFKE